MKIFLRFFLLSGFLHICFNLSGQHSKMDSLFLNALRYASDYPREKVYLHFDNSSYYLGETLWFNAYVVECDSIFHPTTLSKVLHVELMDQCGKKIDEQVVRIKDGRACGQFELEKKNIPGYYEVRAYTRWMRNFGDLNYFSRVFPFYPAPALPGEYRKELCHYRLDREMKVRPQIKQKKLQVDFYPEGGRLVQGIQSLVAFKVKVEKDLFPEAELLIYSCEGDLIGHTKTRHDGMGRFRYHPSSQPGYVKVLYQGDKYKFSLPQASERGFCLAVSSIDKDSVDVTINRKSSHTRDTLGVYISSYGKPYRVLEVIMEDEQMKLRFSTKDLPVGVAQVVVLATNGQPICERMFFVNDAEKYLNIRMVQNKDVYAPGDSVKLQFNVFDRSKIPVSTTFSLAVRAVTNCDIAREADNLRTNLLLSSELKGYIHRPEYYFLPDGEVRSSDLDLLLCVQGWKKYDWNQLTQYATPVTPLYLPEQSLELRGQLKTMIGHKILSNAEVSVFIRDSLSTMGVTKTDSCGNFVFPLDEFTGKYEAIFQSRKIKDNGKKKPVRCYFLLDRHIAPPLRPFEPEEYSLKWDSISGEDSLRIVESEQTEMKKYDNTVVLDEVMIKQRRFRLPLLEYDRSLSAYYDVEQIVADDLDKGKRYVSLYDFLRSHTISFRREALGTYTYKGRMITLIVNGKVCRNIATIEEVMAEVEGVKTLLFCEGSSADKYKVKAEMDTSSDDIMGTETDMEGMGIISSGPILNNKNYYAMLMVVETQPGIDITLKHKAAKGLRPTYIQGYVQPAQFYSPDYSDAVLPLAKDHRRTLYWNPDICTDVQGEADVLFYNARDYTLLNVSVETLSKDGRMGVLEQ